MDRSILEIPTEEATARSRRGFLGLLTASTILPGLSNTGSATTSSNDIDEGNTANDKDHSSSEIPPYPDDPFIQTAFGVQYILGRENHGYANVSTEHLYRTILGLHPDVLAFDQLTKYENGEPESRKEYDAQYALAETLGLPATSGWNVHIEAEEEAASSRYDPVMEESEWAFPDGTPLTSPTEIVAESFDGEPQQTAFEFETLGLPSVFSPGGLELLIEVTTTRLDEGYSGFLVDGVGVFRLHGLDFSQWARAAFRTHLESMSEDQLSALGVDAPQSFDIREYLQENGLSPGENDYPLEDPVFREYLIHQHEGIDTWFDDYRNAIEEYFPERMEGGEIALYANQFTGNFNNPQAANVYISDSMDAIYTELFPRVDPPVELNYKIMRSVGDFSKPVLVKGTVTALGDDQLGDIEPDTPNPMFQRFQVAEAYASGAFLQLPLTARMGHAEEDSVTNWVAGDGSVPDDLRSFADFLWAHERFLSNLEPSGDVAIVWSLPTRIWRHEPTWGIGQADTPKIDSFTGVATILREAGYAYDVLTFGHPRLWDDADQLNRLIEYELVILAGVESITDDQVSALHEYLDGGGSLLCSGPIPDRDAMYEPREDAGDIFEQETATVLNSDPGRQRNENGESDGSLLDALDDHDLQATLQTDDTDVAVHTHRQSDPKRHVIHVVNYDYDPSTDSFSTKTDLSLRLSMTDTQDSTVRYYSPQSREALEVTQNGDSVEVVVPELVEWGFVVVADSPSALIDGDAEAARKALDDARTRLESFSDDGGATRHVAETYLESAETALDFDANSQAETAVDAAMVALDSSQSRDSMVNFENPSFALLGGLVGSIVGLILIVRKKFSK